MIRARVFVTVTALAALAFAVACGGDSSTPAAEDSGPLDASVDDATVDTGPIPDAQTADVADANAPDSHCLYIEGGLTYGCAAGGHGPGDQDDGAGIPPPGDASPDGSDLLFGADCLSNSQCRENVCFVFRAKGQICTRLCGSDAVCPPTSPGCNAQGVCRVVGM